MQVTGAEAPKHQRDSNWWKHVTRTGLNLRLCLQYIFGLSSKHAHTHTPIAHRTVLSAIDFRWPLDGCYVNLFLIFRFHVKVSKCTAASFDRSHHTDDADTMQMQCTSFEYTIQYMEGMPSVRMVFCDGTLKRRDGICKTRRQQQQKIDYLLEL